MSLLQLYIGICLVDELSTVNLSQDSRPMLGTSRCVCLDALTGLLGMGPPRLPVGDFRRLLVGISALKFSELRFPH